MDITIRANAENCIRANAEKSIDITTQKQGVTMAYEIAKPRIIKWLLAHAYRFTNEMMEKIVVQVHKSYCKHCANTEKSMSIENYLDALEYVAFNGKSCWTKLAAHA